jgi:hypothetical protein
MKSLVKLLLNFYKNKSVNFNFVNLYPPGHFYSPLPDLNEINSKSKCIFDRSLTDLPCIEINKDSQIQLLERFSNLYSEIPFSDYKSEKWRYYLDNPFFSYGDGIILYSFLRHFSPKQIIEVGSGFSSAELLDVNDFFQKNIDFTFIEPFPDRLFGLISEQDKKNVKIEIKSVQEVEQSLFSILEANDILFIDSSHVAKINSDVLHILFNILPKLKKGVIIHFHDILWPFEYPQNWLEEGRAWNEAYILRAFLQSNPDFEILYFNSYMALHHRDVVKQLMPRILQMPSSTVTHGNTSLWLRKLV